MIRSTSFDLTIWLKRCLQAIQTKIYIKHFFYKFKNVFSPMFSNTNGTKIFVKEYASAKIINNTNIFEGLDRLYNNFFAKYSIDEIKITAIIKFVLKQPIW